MASNHIEKELLQCYPPDKIIRLLFLVACDCINSNSDLCRLAWCRIFLDYWIYALTRRPERFGQILLGYIRTSLLWPPITLKKMPSMR